MTQPPCAKRVTHVDGDPTSLSSLDDAELVRRARSEPQAFGCLFERYYTPVLNYALRRTLDVDLAEELTSATFFKALRGLAGYSEQGTFKAWLLRIATNEIRMYWRSHKNRRRHQRDYGEQLARITFADDPAETHAKAEDRLRQFARLHEALAALPERYQAAVSLRYFEELSLAEVAEAMDTKLGTVKSLIHRAQERLRRDFDSPPATFGDDRHCKQQTKESP